MKTTCFGSLQSQKNHHSVCYRPPTTPHLFWNPGGPNIPKIRHQIHQRHISITYPIGGGGSPSGFSAFFGTFRKILQQGNWPVFKFWFSHRRPTKTIILHQRGCKIVEISTYKCPVGSMGSYGYICLHDSLIFMGSNVGKCTVRPMDGSYYWYY